MPPTTVPQMVALIRQSALLDETQFEHWLAENPFPDEELPEMCMRLKATQLLSAWQIAQLLEGKTKGFFIGKYKLIRQLGAGAMGSVFLAEHRVMRHQVAIKILAKRLLGKERHIRRFEQEARAAATVNHPRLVRAFDVDSIGNLHYLVMEYVAGENLHKVVSTKGPLPLQVAAEYTRQVAEGLGAAHSANLIHRDIKPSNLILDEQNQIHILDLGLARIVDDSEPSLTLMHDSKMIGTVDYLAPEQALNSHAIDPRADIYSLGCTMYFFLTGQPPFNEGTLPQRVVAHQMQPPKEIYQIRADCPPELSAICLKMLAKNADQRYQAARDVMDVLGQWLAGETATSVLLFPTGNSAIGVKSGGSSAGSGGLGSTPPASGGSNFSASASSAYSGPAISDEQLSILQDDEPEPPRRPLKPSPVKTVPVAAVNKAPKRQPAEPLPVPPEVGLEQAIDLFDDLVLSSAGKSLGASETSASGRLGETSPNRFGSSFGTNGSPKDAEHETNSVSANGAQALLARARQDLQPKPTNWYETMVSLVAEKGDGPGGLSYSLWFLIFFGVVSGLVLAGVVFSIAKSNKDPEVRRGNLEK